MKNKKVKILLIVLFSIICVFCIYSHVQAKYIITKKIDINYKTSDYYFEVSSDQQEILSLPAVVNVKVKNYKDGKYTNSNLKYTISVNDEFIIDDSKTYDLQGNQESEDDISITIDKSNKYIGGNIKITFNVETPYEDEVVLDIVNNDGFDLSKIEPGKEFVLGEVEFDANNQTFFAEIDVSQIDSSVINENLISIGQEINTWKPQIADSKNINLHIYYPNKNNKIILSPLSQEGDNAEFESAVFSGDNGLIKIAFNSNGLYINGRKIFDENGCGEYVNRFSGNSSATNEDYLKSYFDKLKIGTRTIKIGSLEGTNRSTAKYKVVRTYNKAMSVNEMIEKTKIQNKLSDKESTFKELNVESIIKGEKFDLGQHDFNINNNTIFADIDISNIEEEKTLENLISIGNNISSYSATSQEQANIHCYYTSNNRELRLDIILYGQEKSWTITIPENTNNIKIAFCSNGLYINGKLIFNKYNRNYEIQAIRGGSSDSDKTFLKEFFNRWQNIESNVEIGSMEGTNRSTADYNYVRIYNDSMNDEELKSLTEN